MILPLLFVSLIHLSVEQQKPVCLITAPNIIHLGVEETVSVQLHGATEAVSVKLFFNNVNEKLISEQKTVTLNADNQYQAVVNLKVEPDLHQKAQKNDFVKLVAENNQLFTGNKKMANIILSTRRGYIFIQTDKPIYNPGELVNYRIFTLDNYMLPVNDLINVQIFNCKGLLVYSNMMRSEQILQRSLTIPDVELAGHWKITASFHNSVNSETSVEFEVREYVLPMFEVNIEAPKPYHTLTSEIFSFSVTARYTYGKGVNGVAYLRFGLVDSKGERKYLPGIEKQIAVEDGRADLILITADLQRAARESDMKDIVGMKLYIAATVLEKASGDLEEAESSSVMIVTSPYVIDLSKTKKYFTPGGRFSLLGTTTYPDGSRVPNLNIRATIIIKQPGLADQTLTEESSGNQMGDIDITFPVPKQATGLSITVSVEGDDGVIISTAHLTSTVIQPEGGSYLSVEVQHQILQPGQNLQVTLRDITPGPERPSHIYYLVVSKGKVLQAGRVQRTDLTSVSLRFSVDMVPSFHLLAYYYTQNTDSKIVADSVWVDVKDVCKGKIEIVPFRELKPSEDFDVLVRTDSDSSVALSAVDSAVYVLNKKNKLSPQKMFEYMNSYDLSCSVEGKVKSLSVLQSIGLTFICSCETETPPPQNHTCYRGPHRHKRDTDYSKLSKISELLDLEADLLKLSEEESSKCF